MGVYLQFCNDACVLFLLQGLSLEREGVAVPALMASGWGKLPELVAVGQGRCRLPGTEGMWMEQICTGP